MVSQYGMFAWPAHKEDSSSGVPTLITYCSVSSMVVDVQELLSAKSYRHEQLQPTMVRQVHVY